MSKIILCQGIQGSGKSTWAKKWVAEDPTHRARWNNDDVRSMMGPYWVPEREQTKVLNIMKEDFIKRMMACGFDIVIDDMNLNPKTLNQIFDIMYDQNKVLGTNYTLDTQTFFIPVEECIRRDSLRPNPIGEKVIRDTFRRYRDYILKLENRKLYDSLVSQDYSLPHCILVDLDATVALNITGRPYYGEGCAELIHEDYPIDPVIKIVENYPDTVIFVTGREGTPEIIKETTEWINKHIHGNNKKREIFFRDKGNYCKGDTCKENIYLDKIKDKYYVDFVLEDSQKVVDMYRSHDLIVLQPNEGKY